MTKKSGDTREKLLEATINCLIENGISGTSARVIAARAEVNQALIFYHFSTVSDLIIAACERSTAQRTAYYRERFDRVVTVRDLIEVAKELRVEEPLIGSISAIAQILAAGQRDPELAKAASSALELWIKELTPVVERVVGRTPIADAFDVEGLTRAVAAGFVGMMLYDGVAPEAADMAMSSLEQLAVLLEAADDLGPVARAAVRARLRASSKKRR